MPNEKEMATFNDPLVLSKDSFFNCSQNQYEDEDDACISSSGWILWNYRLISIVSTKVSSLVLLSLFGYYLMASVQSII